MPAFKTSVDIGQRALQHCGAQRMDPTLGFNDTTSRGAAEIAFVYDKLREAELQRRLWTFATRRQVLRAVDTNTLLISPALWSPTTIYFRGSIVADQSGDRWISSIPNNLNNDPLLTTLWEPYFGPLTASLYDATQAYFAGEIVYTTTGAGTALAYLSLQNSNSDTPATATAWDATTTFFKNQVVTRSAVAYMSLIDLNTNQDPASAPSLFNISTAYAAGAHAGASDGYIYSSIGSGNIGHDPTLDGGLHWTNTGVLNPWTTAFVGGTGSDKWLLIGGSGSPGGVALTTLNIVYPIGVGPYTQATTANAFRLPAGFLRLCPQNPKAGLGPLGAPAAGFYDDWLIEGDYLITRCSNATLPIRFVANFTDVARMHPMFCEGLSARIALEVSDTITQSGAQTAEIAKIYDRWIKEAGAVDAIEDGAVDPPVDDWIAVRY